MKVVVFRPAAIDKAVDNDAVNHMDRFVIVMLLTYRSASLMCPPGTGSRATISPREIFHAISPMSGTKAD